MSIIKLIFIFCYLIMVLFSFSTYAKVPIKSANTKILEPIHIEVATTISHINKYVHGVYLFKIHCALENCSVERISLNECATNEDGQLGFKVKTYTWASWAGFIEFNLSNNKLELTIFQGTHHQLPAYITIIFSNKKPFNKALFFKATGFIDFSAWPENNNTIEYIPMVGDQLKNLSCPIFLPGITPNP